MENKPSLLQTTMTYGAILGIISIIFSVIMYIIGFMPFNFKRILLITVISLFITVAFVVTGTKSYREKVLGGSITFFQALIAGMLIVVFSTILTSFYSLIFNLFIDPEYTGRVMEATKSWTFDFMNNMGASDAQIETAMEKVEEQNANYTPMKAFFQSLYGSAIFGLILSLITSLFIKKNINPVA